MPLFPRKGSPGVFQQCVSAVPFLLLLSLVLSLLPCKELPSVQDDCFFYLKIADNLHEQGIVSFDGLTPTNGFHPLWMLLLAGLRSFGGGLGFVAATALLSTVLMTLCGVLFLRRGREYSSPVLLIVLVLLLRYIRDFGLMGMETSLLLPLAFLLLGMLDGLNDQTSLRKLWLAGVLIGLCGLARLDSVLLLLPVLFVCFQSCGKRAAVPLLVPGFVAGGSYTILNLVFMGVPGSVSGMMKASGLGFNSLFASQLFLLSDPMGFLSPWGLYLVMLVLAVVVLFLRGMPRSASVSALFMVLFTAAQLFLSSWRLWYWYAYPAVVFLGFGFPPVLQRVYCRLGLSDRLERVVSVFLLLFTLLLALYWGLYYGSVTEDDFRYRNMLFASELNDALPESAVVAMGDRAGSFAFFFHGHVIQTEGLAGDVQLVNALREGSLNEYLVFRECDYLLSWTGPHGVTDYTSWELRIPDTAQSTAFVNCLTVGREDEIMRRAGENDSAILWRFQ